MQRRSWFRLSFCQGWTTATLCWRVSRQTGWIACREYRTMQLVLSLADEGETMQSFCSDPTTACRSALGLSTIFPPCAIVAETPLLLPTCLNFPLSTFQLSGFCRRWSHDYSTRQTQQVWKACFLRQSTSALESSPPPPPPHHQTSTRSSKSSLKTSLLKKRLYGGHSQSDRPGAGQS